MNEIKNRILLAEDDENLGSLLQEYLQAKNYEADWVTNGEKAFRHFEQFHYDLCLLDVMMPIKDGFTLASEIRIMNSSIPMRTATPSCVTWPTACKHSMIVA